MFDRLKSNAETLYLEWLYLLGEWKEARNKKRLQRLALSDQDHASVNGGFMLEDIFHIAWGDEEDEEEEPFPFNLLCAA